MSLIIRQATMRQFLCLKFPRNLFRGYSNDRTKQNEAPKVDNSRILDDKETHSREKLANLIPLPKEVNFYFLKLI